MKPRQKHHRSDKTRDTQRLGLSASASLLVSPLSFSSLHMPFCENQISGTQQFPPFDTFPCVSGDLYNGAAALTQLN